MFKCFILLLICFCSCINNPSGKVSEDSSTRNQLTEQNSQQKTENIVNKKDEENKLKTIKASILLEDYRENSVNASQIYEGNFFLIKGEISRIGTDVFGNPYVCMAYDGVHLTLENKEDAVNLSVGQKATIVGKIGNYIMGNIMVDNCSISK